MLEGADGRKYVPEWVYKVLKKVERKKNKLISNRDFVELKVDTTDRKIEKINGDVLDWLRETGILLQEIENLKTQLKVPSWNEFKKLQERIKALNVKCKFDSFSTPIPSLERFSSRSTFMCFKSIKKASDELLVALKDDDCSVIGLYGRRGSGKTTLVKAMSKKVKFLKIFYEVLFVTVTQNPNIKTIQNEIADSLNIIFNKYTETGRAMMISSAINNLDRPILVIFDDVRKKLDLEGIGIPCDSNRCKVILTAQCQEECDFIDGQKEIQLDPLSILEAWTLFEKHSGIHDEENSVSAKLLNIARDVVYECDGLPGKIIKVGSKLKNKPFEDWQTSLDNLRYSIAKWQIFLSFRGEDTRYSFTGTLYDALCREGFKVFMDDEGLERGDEISSSLINAIKASRISIVVLSENFAYSTWCLDELVTILNCKKEKNQTVWPIFYEVHASDVRNQRNSYEIAMAKQEEKFRNDPEKVKKWRSALSEVAGLSGFSHHKTRYVHSLLSNIFILLISNILRVVLLKRF
jgi:hypothetical protein